MSYILDFRKQIFSIKEKYKLTFEEASIRFDIPMHTLFIWQKRLEPCKPAAWKRPLKTWSSILIINQKERKNLM